MHSRPHSRPVESMVRRPGRRGGSSRARHAGVSITGDTLSICRACTTSRGDCTEEGNTPLSGSQWLWRSQGFGSRSARRGEKGKRCQPSNPEKLGDCARSDPLDSVAGTFFSPRRRCPASSALRSTISGSITPSRMPKNDPKKGLRIVTGQTKAAPIRRPTRRSVGNSRAGSLTRWRRQRSRLLSP